MLNPKTFKRQIQTITGLPLLLGVQFKCAKTDYWNICQLNSGLVQFDIEYSDIQQILRKIFNKYLTNIETVRGFPLSPGRVRCTQREL